MVRTSYRAGKEGVSAEQKPCLAVEEADSSWRVPRSGDYFPFPVMPPFYDIPILDSDQPASLFRRHGK